MEGAGLLNLVTHLTTDTADSGGIDVIMNYIIAMSLPVTESVSLVFFSATVMTISDGGTANNDIIKLIV